MAGRALSDAFASKGKASHANAGRHTRLPRSDADAEADSAVRSAPGLCGAITAVA
ncbi:hypothetical protein [Streptomyces sp. NBC_01497]|uniref:hypothetical protein n=1 Tax=Streptomyces sp. NBC_01497 TaxID=2903885 RepID=UPI002E356437|nr:hypothetical protein [Streptomyces sp. NBC_01497]